MGDSDVENSVPGQKLGKFSDVLRGGTIQKSGKAIMEESGLDEEESKKEDKQKDPTVSLLQLYSFADQFDYVLIFVGLIGSIAHGIALPLILGLFGKLLDGLGSTANIQQTTNKYALDFVYLSILCLGSSWLEVAFWMHTGQRQAAKMRAKYLQALLKQDVAYFDTDTSTGDVVNSMATDTLAVQDAISDKTGHFFHHIATFIASFIVSFTSQWRIAVVTIAIIPILALTGGIYAYYLTQYTAKTASAYAEAGSIVQQAIAQVRTVYSFVAERKVAKHYSDELQKTQWLGVKSGLVKGLGLGATMFVVFCTYAILLSYGSELVYKGEANGGNILSTIFNIVIGSTSIALAMSNLAPFGKARVSAFKIFQVVNHEPTINKPDQNAETRGTVEGYIELHDVDFCYPARPDVPIFQKFSLSIPPGTSVAIVGSSGSGKSTVVSLIERFYDPTGGEVLLDGVNLKKLDLKWLRGQIGLVNQEPALFATTIAGNITYGSDDATQEEIEEAAKAANAHSFISHLPGGYQTQVGERGVQLSGGQRQRIAIARAIVKNPKVLLLDEATSALDAESEKVVQEALDRIMVGRTTVVVAHRLYTIRNADTIAVVEQGKIVESGTHSDLMVKEGGAYVTLVQLQHMARMSNEVNFEDVSSPSRFPPRFSSESDYRQGYSSPTRYISGVFSPSRFISDISNTPSASSPSRFTSRKSRSSMDGSMNWSMKDRSRLSDRSGQSFAEGDEEAAYQVEQLDGRSLKPTKGSFKLLIAMTKADWKYGSFAMGISIAAGCFGPLNALILGNVLADYYNPDQNVMRRHIRKFSVYFVLLGIASLIVNTLQHYSLGVVGEKLVKGVREKLFSKILRNEVGWFDETDNNSSQLTARLASDAATVRAALGDRTSVVVQNLVTVIVAFAIAFMLQWKLSLVLVGAFPLIIAANVFEQWILTGFAKDHAKAYERATQVAGEAVSNIRTVAAFSAEEKVEALFIKELEGSAKQSFKEGHVAGFAYGVSQFLLYSSTALGLWYAGELVDSGQATFPAVIKTFLIILISAFVAAEAITVAPDFVKGGQALTSLFLILDRMTMIEPDDPEGRKPEKIRGDIHLRHVALAYPSRPDVIVLRNLNLKVTSGHSLALVGASGCGKSSIISLIERFYDPVAGEILIDGRNIKTYNLQFLRQHIALVQQEPALFSTTLYENILYGREGASEAEVIEAGKAANAHKFISSLPDGYKTLVGERGVQLSGGQKQRVAIARAVLKDPTIFLLDEATSALDAESEKVVQEAIERLMQGRTTVIVAHRLSTVRGADSIAVVQEGKIAEQGSHKVLLSKDGAYTRLIRLQYHA
ncbi:unnamed protein product [Calypogeia fissa]